MASLDTDALAQHLAPSGALLAAQIALGAAIDRCAVSAMGHDATSIDLLVRLTLAPDPRLRAVELSEQMALSPSHISRMLDRSERAGLVQREPDPSDRRASQVTMTDAGQDVAARFAPSPAKDANDLHPARSVARSPSLPASFGFVCFLHFLHFPH